MSTNTTLHPAPHEPSGEHLFFAMAIAFWVVLAAIILGAFLPLAVGVGMIFVVLAAVLTAVGVFLARLLDD